MERLLTQETLEEIRERIGEAQPEDIVYQVYDAKAAQFEPRFMVSQMDHVVMRGLYTVATSVDANGQPTHIYGQWPADFYLFRTAMWDRETSKFLNIEPPENLGTIQQLINVFEKERE